MSERLRFKISSALKDIIGKDLITDDFIAVFELVKNSYDAYASKVDIYFHDLETPDPFIIIKDNGKGMTADDLKDKWLFVAYSAKKEGTEDFSSDYRDSIYQKRIFAGAKGIGRFSCDRLGSKLILETTSSIPHSSTERLVTEWKDFEDNISDEFVDITSEHQTLEHVSEHGTTLKISNLRANWDRIKILKLKDSLAKLINPNNSEHDKVFEIEIHAQDFVEIDRNQLDEKRKVNGIIKNFIFKELGLKTTRIEASIDENGEFLTTELIDGGTRIYKVSEQNQFKRLKSIRFTIYYLNQSAKMTFARRMGLSSKAYGNIFLYKNGFRIYPFGESTEDPLKIELRKSRKRQSLLGTGEIMGQIEISGRNDELRETSSRGDGFIRNETYNELELSFFQVLSRLEKYVVEVQQWGLSIEDSSSDVDIRNRVTELIEELTGSSEILSFEYPPDFIEILSVSQSDSAKTILNNISKIASKSGDNELVQYAKKAASQVEKLRVAKDEAEQEAVRVRQLARASRIELEETVTENLFLKSIKSQELEDALNLMHHIGISTSTIQNYLKGLVFRIEAGIQIDNSELKKIIGNMNFELSKIYTISRYATKANFKMSVASSNIDLVSFITEYLTNIVRPFMSSKIVLNVSKESGIEAFYVNFKPIELTIIIDNLISNSKKCGARNIEVWFELVDKALEIHFEDDGVGIPVENQDKIFSYGFTTTDGSGLGLTHVKEMLNKQGATISINRNKKEGAEFIMRFKK